MHKTKIKGFDGLVVLTAGAYLSGVGRIFGVFRDTADARKHHESCGADDSLVLGIISGKDLTEHQIEQAEQNSDALCDHGRPSSLPAR